MLTGLHSKNTHKNCNVSSSSWQNGFATYVLRPTLLIDECTPAYTTNTIVTFVNDTTVVELISRGEESVYRTKVNVFIDGNCGKMV